MQRSMFLFKHKPPHEAENMDIQDSLAKGIRLKLLIYRPGYIGL